VSGYTFGIAVREDAPWQNLGALLESAKRQPQKISYGTTGAGTGQHILLEEMAKAQGINWVHVPFKGDADMLNALLGGHIDFILSSAAWAPLVETGKLNLLATLGDQRAKNWPDVRTAKEQGLDYVLTGPFGLGGPAGIPNDRVTVLHEAFHIATSGRPGPVVIDIPKDVQFSKGVYQGPAEVRHAHNYAPRTKGDAGRIAEAVAMIAKARRPILYTGGGVINAGPKASELLRELAALTGAPVTSTLMGLGAFPASSPQWLGMLGMHGSFEANNAMHGCDVMVAVGARFDDRVTGRLDAFAPGSRKIHIDIDASSIGKNVRCDVGIVGDAASVLADMIAVWKQQNLTTDKAAMADWWKQIEGWRARNSFGYRPDAKLIKPQHAIQRLYELTKDRDAYITTEVGQHQMWAAQFYHFEQPNRWMTSGGLGTMGYGLPAAVGVQIAHPDSLVIDIAGDASVQMTMQEMSTAVQHDLPIKIFILNNEWMGMVRQWQQLLHGERYSHSYSASLPDFVKLAEAYGGVGLRAEHPGELDDKIREMISVRKPVIFDCRVTKEENCFPMIVSGKAHNEMTMADEATDLGSLVSEAGKRLV